MYKVAAKIAAFIYCAAIVVISVVFTILDANNNLVKEVSLEAGGKINIEDFFNDCPADARFLTDISSIDTKVPAVYQLAVQYGEMFEDTVTLKIEDHTGPRGVALPKELYARTKWPKASECVGFLYDLSGVAKVEYQNGTPNIEIAGDYMIPVEVTDWYDNKTVIVENFNDEPVDVKLVGTAGLKKLTDLETGETVDAVQDQIPAFFRRRIEPASKAAMTIKPHSYRAFRYE